MPYAATIGFFDGVHRGHQHVLKTLRRYADEHGLQTMVVTFENHPLSVVCPDRQPPLLLTPEEKVRKLQSCGIDRIVMLPFTTEMMNQPAYDFMLHRLKEELDVELLMLGYDNRFGKRKADEGFPQYVEYGREMGIRVVEGPRPEEAGLVDGRPISSSLIRELMDNGRMEEAEGML